MKKAALACIGVVVAVAGAWSAGQAAAPAAAKPRALARSVSDKDLAWGPCPPLFAAGCQIAVLQGDPSAAHADVFFRVPAGYRIAPHTHTSAEHMVLVEGELEVKYAGQPAVRLKPGTYAYGPAAAPHEGRCVSTGPCTLMIAFEIAVDALAYSGPLR